MAAIQENISRSAMILITGIVGLVFVYSRMRFMEVPFDRDEGSYLYMGYSFIKGYIPYVDFYEMKPPGIFLVYGLFHILFGSSTFLLHFGLLLLQLYTAWLVYKIVASMFQRQQPGMLAACVYVIFNLSPNFMGFGIMSEHFFILFVLLSMYFLVKPMGQKVITNMFVAGLFFGMAAMIRQHAIFFVFPVQMLIIHRSRSEKGSWFKNILYFASGSMAVIIALVGYVAVRGGFEEMVYWIFTHPSEKYITKVSWADGQPHLMGYINNIFFERHFPMVILFGVGLVFIIKNIFKNNLRWENSIALLFFVGAFLTVFPGFRFYGHYWLMVFPFLAIIAGLWLDSLTSDLFRYSSIAVVAILFLIQITKNNDLYFKIKADQIYQRMYEANPNYSLQKITKYLKRKIKEKDEIFVFGSEPQAYYELKKISAQPHVFISYLHLPSDRALAGQRQTMTYMTNQKPEFIIHLQNPISIGMKENSHQDLYQWIFSFEDQYYEKIALAEMNGRNKPVYYYGNEANREPTTDNYIFLYQRRQTR